MTKQLVYIYIHIFKYKVFFGCPVLKTLNFHSWVWVQSLVGELRSCMPHGTIKLYIYYICKKIVIICEYTHTCVCVCVLSCFSYVQLFATAWTVAHPLGSSLHGILQARILEWAAMPSSRVFPHPGLEPTSPASLALQVASLPLSDQGSPYICTKRSITCVDGAVNLLKGDKHSETFF